MKLDSFINKLTTEVEFPVPGFSPGIVFSLNYLDKATFRTLTDSCYVVEFDPKTRQPSRQLDMKLLRDKVIGRCVNGWRGMTYRKLKTLVPLDSAAVEKELKNSQQTWDSEIPYSKDLLNQILDHAYSLEPWLIESVMNLAVFQDISKEEEIAKN